MTLHGVVKPDRAHRRAPETARHIKTLHKPLVVVLLLLAGAAVMAGGSAEAVHLAERGEAALRIIPAVAAAVAGLGWAAVGGVLAWLRPGNSLGWIMLGVGTLTQLGLAEESFANAGRYGVIDPADPWQGRGGGLVLSAATGLAIYLMVGLLPVLYPSGRWPGRQWLLPAGAVSTGALLLQVQWSLAMLGPAAPPAQGPAASGEWLARVPALIFALGVLTVWAMSVVRLVRAGHPERPQLLWLLSTVAALLATQSLGSALPGLWVQTLCLYLLPAAVAVGILRYRLLGIETVLRRGLVYGMLTAGIVVLYAAVLAAAGVQLTGEPLVAVVAAALVAVGLSPLRTWLQRAVDALLYGRRADPITAVSQLGSLAAGAPEHELLHVVLAGVQEAVRAPHARILKPDGATLASVGAGAPPRAEPAPGSGPAGTGATAFTARLALGSVLVGTLEVGGRTPGERYPGRDERLLRAMAPQVAAVVHALALAGQLQDQRDAVLAATGRERERLRRDLHDGLGPSLTGVGLGLQALGDAVSDEGPRELLGVLAREITATVADVRRILNDLAPAALAYGTLAVALPQRIAAVAGHLPSTVDVGTLPPLPPAVAEAAYNIASEAVANAVRHARATKVGVEVMAAAGQLRVSVHDDGGGIPAEASPGIGLASMRARAAALGGTLTVASSPAGTAVTLTLPLETPGGAGPGEES